MGHAYLIFVSVFFFSLSLVKQSRKSIRISRGSEKKKKETQLEAAQDVLGIQKISTQNTSLYHLLFTSNPLVSSSDLLYETACR